MSMKSPTCASLQSEPLKVLSAVSVFHTRAQNTRGIYRSEMMICVLAGALFQAKPGHAEQSDLMAWRTCKIEMGEHLSVALKTENTLFETLRWIKRQNGRRETK